jgi:dUTP pyrophosphatase
MEQLSLEAVDTLEVLKLEDQATLPTRAHPDDAGLDLYGMEEIVLAPRAGVTARTGIAMALPKGHVGMIADRSSLGKRGVKTAGGIVDAGYRGEIKVLLWNLTDQEIRLEAGDRIAQMLILPIQTPAVAGVSELDSTRRGDGGFGSTGR